MIGKMSGIARIGAVAVLFIVAGCAAAPPEDVRIQGRIEAVESVNPDALGRPSPLHIKVFQLKTKDAFEVAEYFALAETPDAELGADMLGVESIMLTPGEVRPYEGEYDPETRFIGVIAGYRDIHQAQWRAVMEMPEKSIMNLMRRGGVIIRADSLAISVSVDE